MRTLDRVFGCLLFLGGIGHGFGSWKAHSNDPGVLIWALSASFAVFLLAAMNLLRAGRSADHALGWICFAGCLVWSGFAVWVGLLMGNVFDFRPLLNLVFSLALAGFSLRSALRTST